jgi:hypothetical protein
LLILLVGCLPTINQAPIITSTPITLAVVGTPYTDTVKATDPDGDTLTYSLAVNPIAIGMTISATGLISGWTPTAVGTFDVIVTVSDGTLDITQSFTIVVSVAAAPGYAPAPAAAEEEEEGVGYTGGYGGGVPTPVTPVTPTYSVTYNGNENTGGDVPVDPNSYAVGVEVTVLGNTGSLVNTGYTFVGWAYNTAGTGDVETEGTTFPMVTDGVTLYAKWETYELTMAAGPDIGGDATDETGTSPYAAFTEVSIKAEANVGSGWEFGGWSALAGTFGNAGLDETTFTMPGGDVTVTANFVKKTYTITASAGTGGSISPSGPVTVDWGSNQLFTITPDSFFAFYGIEEVLVDLNPEGPVDDYTFTNVTEDHTIHASFILLGRVYNENKGEYYDTIQLAIDDAGSGHIILVSAGTYPENVVIPPDKDNLQLIGIYGSDETSIAPTSGRPVTTLGWVGLIDGFRIQGFTLVTADASHAFLAGSGTNDGTTYTMNLEFEDIVVNGVQRGIGLNAVQGVTFVGVHISNISISGEAAIELTGVEDFTFTQGSIVGNYIGVRIQPTGQGDIGEGYGPNDNIQIHDSSLVGNVFAVENQDDTTIIDATNNWWGDASGPYHPDTNPDGLGNVVSDYVDYSFWWY